MKIVSAEFLKGAVSCRHYPKGIYPEFAFAGRSNVGKSSLIKSLLNRKKLVKTSATPGKTREINFFKINDNLLFADLPGYGFARVPPSLQRQWKKMIEEYILKRETLRAIVFIIDIRRDPTPLDLELKNWLESYGKNYILIATKSDKLNLLECNRQIEKIKKAFLVDEEKELIVYSSKTNSGRKELWNKLLKLAENNNAS